MAIEDVLEYATQSQAAKTSQSQQNRKNVSAKQSKQTTGRNSTVVEKIGKNSLVEQSAVGMNPTGDAAGVRYDVSQRTNDVAAWYQEFVRQEQEAQLSLLGITEQEEKAAKEEEKNPVREALEKADVVLKSLQRMLERMREQQKQQKEQKQKNKGKLSYSYRKISNSISAAKTSMQASNALSSATANLSMIRRKAASGKYEEKEIQLALQHAQKMVRVARKKVANLKSEAQQQKHNQAKESHKKQQVSMVYQAPQRSKVEKELQQLQEELKSRENQEKNRNRRDEDMDLMQADLQYLRRKIDLLKNHGLSLSSQNQQIVDDMVAAAMGFVSVGMKEQAMEAEQSGQETATPVESTSSADAAATGGGFETTV